MLRGGIRRDQRRLRRDERRDLETRGRRIKTIDKRVGASAVLAGNVGCSRCNKEFLGGRSRRFGCQRQGGIEPQLRR